MPNHHAARFAAHRSLPWGHVKASMTVDAYADLSDEDLDEVAGRLNAVTQATTDALLTAKVP